ncbi:MAG: DUF4392 domain-containing protein [Bifidobacteriaceae bacterium]|jgi:hypothetical protein|nr:DUF4392 domain-containing protein [Bifidobacteriaceae bacterium]
MDPLVPLVSPLEAAAYTEVGRGSAVMGVHAAGQLARAAGALAEVGPRLSVLIVTGFFIKGAAVPAPETDGPLGALELFAAVRAMGGEAWLATDEFCAPVLTAALPIGGAEGRLLVAPADGFEDWLEDAEAWMAEHQITHLVFIERAGPGRDGVIRDMRGTDISGWTLPMQRLASKTSAQSIGVGDGGNEIGMGAMPTEVIERVVKHGADIRCVVSTDNLIVGGTSNWGAHALVGALHSLGTPGLEPWLEEEWHREALTALADAGACDGVDRVVKPTVDGLTGDLYFGVVRAISAIATRAK